MRIYKRGEHFHVTYSVNGRRFRESLKTKSRQEAERIAVHRVRLAQRRAEGLETTGDATRPVIELIGEYGALLERRERTEGHIRQVVTELTNLAYHSGVTTIGDWTPDAMRAAMQRYQDRSPRQQNKLIGYAQAFFRWLKKTERWTKDPTGVIEKVPHRRAWKERRALTRKELARLLETAPEPRTLVYRVACATGFRRSELERLTPADVDLEGGLVTLDGSRTKNRRPASIPIGPSTTAPWRTWLEDPYYLRGANRVSCDRVLPPIPNVKTLRGDLKRAEIEAGDARLDFHSLRVTFVTSLFRAGVPLETAMKLSRHLTPAVIVNTYAKLDPSDMREATNRLDSYLS